MRKFGGYKHVCTRRVVELGIAHGEDADSFPPFKCIRTFVFIRYKLHYRLSAVIIAIVSRMNNYRSCLLYRIGVRIWNN